MRLCIIIQAIRSRGENGQDVRCWGVQGSVIDLEILQHAFNSVNRATCGLGHVECVVMASGVAKHQDPCPAHDSTHTHCPPPRRLARGLKPPLSPIPHRCSFGEGRDWSRPHLDRKMGCFLESWAPGRQPGQAPRPVTRGTGLLAPHEALSFPPMLPSSVSLPPALVVSLHHRHRDRMSSLVFVL